MSLYTPPACPICIEPMSRDLAVLPACGHVYHHACILPWVKKHKNCPECRKRAHGVVQLFYTVNEETLGSPAKGMSSSATPGASTSSPGALDLAKARIKTIQAMLNNATKDNQDFQEKIKISERATRKHQETIQSLRNDITKNKRKLFRTSKENNELKAHIEKLNKERYNLQKLNNAKEYSETMDLYSLIKKTKGKMYFLSIPLAKF